MGRLGPIKLVSLTGWMTVDTPTEHSKLVCNRWVTERFVGPIRMSLYIFLIYNIY